MLTLSLTQTLSLTLHQILTLPLILTLSLTLTLSGTLTLTSSLETPDAQVLIPCFSSTHSQATISGRVKRGPT